MNDVAKAREQGVHFVPIHYKESKDYYDAKYKNIEQKWNGVFDNDTTNID